MNARRFSLSRMAPLRSRAKAPPTSCKRRGNLKYACPGGRLLLRTLRSTGFRQEASFTSAAGPVKAEELTASQPDPECSAPPKKAARSTKTFLLAADETSRRRIIGL